MKKIIFCTLLFLFYWAAAQSQTTRTWNINDVEIFDDFDDMEYIFEQENDTTYLINFWATWCSPCVKELPFIDPLTDIYKDEKFKVILVSLDFEDKIKTKLMPFLAKKKIISDVHVLTDTNYNKWIDKVEHSWSGEIPVTIVYNHNKKKWNFYEKQFHSIDEVKDIVKDLINKK